jgi:hypothetical protein
MLALAPWLLVLVVQDYRRWVAFVTQWPRQALVNDIVFNTVQAVVFVLVAGTDRNLVNQRSAIPRRAVRIRWPDVVGDIAVGVGTRAGASAPAAGAASIGGSGHAGGLRGGDGRPRNAFRRPGEAGMARFGDGPAVPGLAGPVSRSGQLAA